MGGASAIRGFLLQSIVSILDALDNDVKWTEIGLESDELSEKVDIVYKFPAGDKIMQVKSSQNQITLPLVTQWSADLEQSYVAAEYELVLLGPTTQGVIENPTIGKVKIPTPKVLDILALIEQASHKLDKYLSSRGFLPVPPFIREEFISSLISRFSTYSTNGQKITRQDFDKLLQQWFMNIYPSAIRQSFDMQCSILLDTFVMLGGQTLERPLLIPFTLINESQRSVIVEWIAFKVIGNNVVKKYIPLSFIDYPKLIQGRRNVHGENILGQFSQFVVKANEAREVAIAFNQDIADNVHKPTPWTPGKYEFQFYIKYRDSTSPKMIHSLSDVLINQQMLQDVQQGISIANTINKIEI
ncbi:MAG TPA: hypothetical protein VF421_13140 [Niabella sp.]